MKVQVTDKATYEAMLLHISLDALYVIAPHLFREIPEEKIPEKSQPVKEVIDEASEYTDTPWLGGSYPDEYDPNDYGAD